MNPRPELTGIWQTEHGHPRPIPGKPHAYDQADWNDRMIAFLQEQQEMIVVLRAQRDTLIKILARFTGTKLPKYYEPKPCKDCKVSFQPTSGRQLRCIVCQKKEVVKRAARWVADAKAKALKEAQ